MVGAEGGSVLWLALGLLRWYGKRAIVLVTMGVCRGYKDYTCDLSSHVRDGRKLKLPGLAAKVRNQG